ncbi:MAG TPA: thioredoxin family protein [Terriglobia bacterium]|nr:thioredoxin family protein [Terriglobia bacterium]
MKPIYRFSVAIILAIAIAASLPAQTTPPAANEVLAKAVRVAGTEQKNVLVIFGASWCSWCKRLDAMLASPEVGKLFHDNFVIEHLTIQESKDKVHLENPGAQEMVDNAGGKGSGVPVYLFFDSTGNRIATSMSMPGDKNIGHPATPEEIKVFEGLLERTAPKMTAAQRQQVSEFLSKQK